ncbi:MAG: TA system antitoxin ParD family protein [Alphaproteobacteria bacterium]
MSRAVKLSEMLLTNAGKYANIFSRSIPKQIEHWAKIGKIAEDNPNLSYEFIKEALIAKEEIHKGDVFSFEFRE